MRLKGLLARLLALVGLALLPALGLHLYAEVQARQVREQLVREEALRLVQLVTSEQQRIIEAAEQVLTTLGDVPSVSRGNGPVCHALLARLLRSMPRYGAVLGTDPDGRVVCAGREADRGLDLSDRPYVRRALESDGLVVGGYVVGRGSGKPRFALAKSFRGEAGQVAGVVILDLDLDWLGQALHRLPLPEGATASVADANGVILARRPGGARYVGQPIPEWARSILDGTAVQVREMRGFDGVTRIFAYSPPGAEPKGLLVGVGLDKDVVFASAVRANRLGLALVALGAALALVLTLLGASPLIRRPVRRLLTAAARWREGDLSARTGLGGRRTEFGRLGEAFDAMAAALEARTAALEDSQARLAQAQKLEAVGRLTGGVAHDFNNLLQAVRGNLELAQMASAKGDAKRAGHLLDNAQRAIDRGGRLTAQLLAFSRKQVLQPERVVLSQLVAETGELLHRAAGDAVRVEVHADPALWPCLLDPAQCEAALLNLAVNARDAMPLGGTLTLNLANTALDAEAAGRLDLAPGDYVRVDVADTGAGMAPEVLARVLEPFFTTKEVGKGSGLGLPQAHGFARQSGGALALESAPGCGTTVSLFFLRTVTADAGNERPAGVRGTATSTIPAPSRAAASAKILLVEDDHDVLDALQHALIDAGHAVVPARDVAEALAVLRSSQDLDLLFSDVVLPGVMSGVQLAIEARRLRPGLPTLLTSGHTADELAGRGLAGGFEFLAKPYGQRDMLARVAALAAELRQLVVTGGSKSSG